MAEDESRPVNICCDCGGEAAGGALVPVQTDTGWRYGHRCWTCFLGPPPPPCCKRAAERGYRRGYRDGYWYALWDVGKYLRIPDTLWQQFERFYYETLKPWVWRASRRDGAPVRMEFGPRFRKETVRRKQGA